MKTRTIKNFDVAGFTLIEVMITVAVIAILAAVALPNYFDYVTRSRLVEAKTSLVDMRTRLEQYFLDNRAYPDTCIAPAPGPAGTGKIYLPANAKYFAVACQGLPATYTVTATGLGFVFSIDAANVRKTKPVPTGWTESETCWVSRKNGDC